MSSYQYRKSHCGDKTVVRSSYLHNGISYTGKMATLYWFSPLVVFPHKGQWSSKCSLSTRQGMANEQNSSTIDTYTYNQNMDGIVLFIGSYKKLLTFSVTSCTFVRFMLVIGWPFIHNHLFQSHHTADQLQQRFIYQALMAGLAVHKVKINRHNPSLMKNAVQRYYWHQQAAYIMMWKLPLIRQ